MIKTCPNCGNNFECKENDILNCDCANVNLSTHTRKKIASLYDSCLCMDCLYKFERASAETKDEISVR